MVFVRQPELGELMCAAVTPRPTACLMPAVGMCNSRITTRCCYKERSCIFCVSIQLLCQLRAPEEPVWFMRDCPSADKFLFQVSLVVVSNT